MGRETQRVTTRAVSGWITNLVCTKGSAFVQCHCKDAAAKREAGTAGDYQLGCDGRGHIRDCVRGQFKALKRDGPIISPVAAGDPLAGRWHTGRSTRLEWAASLYKRLQKRTNAFRVRGGVRTLELTLKGKKWLTDVRFVWSALRSWGGAGLAVGTTAELGAGLGRQTTGSEICGDRAEWGGCAHLVRREDEQE